jgi:3-methylfumaryl-CoA hydratase
MSDSLAIMVKDLQAWIGRSRSLQDELSPQAVRRLVATLDCEPVSLEHGASVPSHWLSILFDDAAPASMLGRDGHLKLGEFLPPVPLPRRMLAGRKLTFERPLRIAEPLTRISTITKIEHKSGRSGELIFVTVEHRICDDKGTIAVELHDTAYREEASSKPSSKGPAAQEERKPDWQIPFTPDTTLLFRYSALTFNGHRIHYDADYVRDVEGYPGLVVNGGLTTIMLLEAARAQCGRHLKSYSLRTRKPLFVNDAAFLCGGPLMDNRMSLYARDAAGDVLIEIKAEYAA